MEHASDDRRQKQFLFSAASSALGQRVAGAEANRMRRLVGLVDLADPLIRMTRLVPEMQGKARKSRMTGMIIGQGGGVSAAE